jgi:riboflavin synthase
VFSGIIESLGTVEALERRGEDARLVVRHEFGDVALTLGESICTSGTCLTAVDFPPGAFVADLSGETLRRTTLGTLQAGDVVNLERSLRLGDRLSGHFVFGHVDGVGRVEMLEPSGAGFTLRVATDASLAPYLVDKGSIAVDGISLTMCDVRDASFAVAVIPHTFDVTTLSRRRAGDPVNVEIDMLARYARRALEFANTRS